MSAPRIRVARTEVVLDTVPLRRRHWAALVALLLLAMAGWWIDAGRLTTALAGLSPPAWYAIRSEDDEGHVYAVTASGAARRAGVVVVGTSVAMASLWDDKELTKAAGLGIANLSTRAQGLLESLYVLHSAQLRPGQLVVVMVTPLQLSRNRVNDYRLSTGTYGPAAPFAETFQRDLPGLAEWLEPRARRSGDRAFQKQWLYRMVYGGLRHWSAVYLYGDRRSLYEHHPLNNAVRDGDPAILRNSRANMKAGLATHYDRNWRDNAHILDVLLRFVHSRGARAILLDAPRIAGDSLLTYGEWWPRFRSDVRAVADSNGVPIVDFNPALALDASGFRDAWHLARTNRARWSRAFVQHVALWCPEAGRLSRHGCD